jgi:hypothetical protein
MSRAAGWWGLLLGCLLGLDLPAAQAETVKISTRYRPDQADFIDVNPPGRMCVRYVWHCLDWWKGFAIDLPIEYTKVTEGYAADKRDQFYLSTPQQVRVAITHDQTGERQEVVLSFVAFSQRVWASIDTNPAHAPSPGECGLMMLRRASDHVEADWQLPGTCFTTGLVPRGQLLASPVDDVQTILRLDAPSPHRMKHGMWRGSVTFSAGNGGDIDFGNRVTMTRGSLLQIDLELEVVHAFVVDFPPGSHLAVLEPPGGWPSFWNSHRQPSRLYREHPFRLWSSGPFKVYIECERSMVDRCGLRQRGGSSQIPFSVAISLPGAVSHNGQAVRNLRLPVGQANALQFDSSTVSYNQPGALRYEVDGAAAATMQPGETYTGWVTIIFDAEL